MPLCSPLPYWIGLAHVINRILQKWWCITFEARSWKPLQLLPCSLLDYSRGVSSRSEPTWRGTEAACQPPRPPCQACEWAFLGTHLPAPVRLPDDGSHSLHLDCNLINTLTQNHPFKPLLNLWLQKLWDVFVLIYEVLGYLLSSNRWLIHALWIIFWLRVVYNGLLLIV